MWPQQEGANKLINIIQQLQLHRETGQLTIIHGDGAAAEEGNVVFANGKVVEARIGRRIGSNAFNRLSTLENCSCNFIRSTDKPGGSSPFFHDRTSERFANEPTTAPPTPFPQGYTPPPQMNPFVEQSKMRSTSNPLASPIPHQLVLAQVAFQRIEQFGLTRFHRRLFLLIDGQRSIAELSRLMGKEVYDIHLLLRDLEQAALISSYFR